MLCPTHEIPDTLDRIEVRYGNDSVLVSPKDRPAFVQAIRASNPSVTVEFSE